MAGIPLPPEHLIEGVGWGDFYAIGYETVELIKRFANLRPDDRILDVGSGLGRITYPLVQELTAGGTYDGIDTVPEYIDWCTNGLGLDPDRIRFHRADLYSSFYNPNGTVRPEEYRFPWPDNTFTLTIATSLYTHLSAPAAINYLRETFRTLVPGGRCFASFFVLDGYARDAIAQGTYPSFPDEFEHGRLWDAKNPDLGVAFDSEWLLQQFQGAGFEIAGFHRGRWREPDGPSYQDLVIARKP